MKTKYEYLIFKEDESSIQKLQPHRSFKCFDKSLKEIGQVKFSLRVGSMVFIQAKYTEMLWFEVALNHIAHFLSQVNKYYDTPEL